MGRIKTKLIKRTTKQLVRDHGDILKTTFEENKKVMSELVQVKSTKLRNAIAGYITRQMKAKQD